MIKITSKLKKKKNIWFFHHYATSPDRPGLTRSFDFAKQLNSRGYDCTIFSSSYLHYAGRNIITDNSLFKLEIFEGVRFVYIKTSSYKSNDIKRVKNFFDYYFNVFKVSKEILSKIDKPDTIIASSAHPLALLAGQKISKKFKVPCICEVRDLWPESFVAYKILNQNSLIMRLLYSLEKKLYKNADKLIFTMEGGKDYIIQKKWDLEHGGPIDVKKVFHINNGVDLEKFHYNKEKYVINLSKDDNKKSFKVVYTGSIRKVNKVNILLEVAEKLRNESIEFLIFGDGDQLPILKESAALKNLENVKFEGRIEKKMVPNVISSADLNIILGENKHIFNFGISPNKLFEYFAAGRPILTTFKPKYSLIERYNSGTELEVSDPTQISNEILRFKNMSAEKYFEICSNTKKVSEIYDFKVLTKKLINIL